MREHYGAIAPVEIVPGLYGWLVVSYEAAKDVLLDSGSFKKDPTEWAAQLPADHPVLGMLGPRPNPLFTDGAQHARYRRVVTDALASVAPHHLRDTVRVVADYLIDQFAGEGTCDLIGQFARPLPSYLFNRLFGQSDDEAPGWCPRWPGSWKASVRKWCPQPGSSRATWATCWPRRAPGPARIWPPP